MNNFLSPFECNLLMALQENRLHGYALLKDQSIRNRYNLRFGKSQLYQSLKKLKALNFIQEKAISQKKAPTKLLLRITRSGTLHLAQRKALEKRMLQHFSIQASV